MKPLIKIKELMAMLQEYDTEKEIIFSWVEDDAKEGYGITENVINEDESTYDIDTIFDEIDEIKDEGFYIVVYLKRSLIERGLFKGIVGRGGENE